MKGLVETHNDPAASTRDVDEAILLSDRVVMMINVPKARLTPAAAKQTQAA